MKLKTYIKSVLAVMALVAMSAGVSAQTTYLLMENFNGATFPPAGWTTVDSQEPGAVNHWETYYDSRTDRRCAHVKDGDYSANEPVKEEVLLTPVVELNGFFDLNFSWEGATAQSIGKLPNPQYDFQVRVREEGSDQWTKIFSFLEEDLVRNSGVAYPWTAWAWNPSAINLTDWNGKKVQFAFVHCKLMPGSNGNDIWVDDVSIVSSQQITGPIAGINPKSFIFPTTYIGGKKYSDVFTLKNTGRDVLTVTGISGLTGTDFGTTLDASAVSLKTGDTYDFQFSYSPTASGAPSTVAVISTNGGDVSVNLSGTKRIVPEDALYEGFEGDVFPPLGWTTNQGWAQYGVGLSGDASAYCSFPYEGANLITPRLDLSDSDDHVLQFTYFEQYDPQFDDSFLANYFKVYLSTDGGKNYKEIFNSEDYELNQINTVALELDGQGSDNCYVKFSSFIPGFTWDSLDDSMDYSIVFLDDVLLPSLYGTKDAPASSEAVSPKNGAINVYHKNVKLEWTGALFATNYKLYLGSSATNFDVINGQDMGTATSYVVPRLDYGKSYFWKVVGCNGSVENTAAPVWNFTVIEDQSVTELPYSCNFDEGFALGWNPTNEGNTKWSLVEISPYGGTGQSAMASGYQEGTIATLETPEIHIPASGETLVSFVWGNSAPVGLQIDGTGQKVNNTTSPGKECTIYFDVEVDGRWTNLGMLHEEGENKYWYRESYNLSPYAGKAVTFRWRYEVYAYSAAAASIDNFLVETASTDKAMVAFNVEEWNAGYVNNCAKVTSRNPILLSNIGSTPLKVRSVVFTTPNFTSTLVAGTEVAANRSASFAITYNAGTEAGEVADDMVVTFENGTSVAFPVKGTTLAADVFYYDFEADEHASTQPKDFTTVDRDGYGTVMPVLIYYPKRGTPFAYIVLNITGPYADWRNVYPVSGEQVLASMGEMNGALDTDDWIISPELTATAESNFRFYAKCYGDSDQVFSQNKVEVLVSTDGKEIASFATVLPAAKIPWAGSEGKWTEYNVPLGDFAGQKVHIAVRHMADRDGFVSFFDDFWFEHFSSIENGIDGIETSPAASEELYDLNGLRVDPATAAPGIYVSRRNGQSVKVVK